MESSEFAILYELNSNEHLHVGCKYHTNGRKKSDFIRKGITIMNSVFIQEILKIFSTRDWYVFTASPKKKNVVIVVDESGSMSIPNGGFKHPNTTLRVDIAKDAARTVLETFSPTDHVGVVAFSNEPRSPSGCLGSEIARATVENKKIIHQFIDSIKPKKDTYYGKAFRSAFKLLREAKHQTPELFEDSLDMILFLTDGTPSESNINSILEEIIQGQDSVNNTIKIFVYGFGQEILNSKSQSKTDLLLMIADQNNQNMSSMFGIAGGKQLQWPQLSNLPDTSKPIGPVGNLTILPDVDTEQLRNVMGSYYTKFPLSRHTDYSISLPHIEDELGLVTTLGIPTLDKGGNFFGVAGIDLSLLLMFYEVVHFRQGQHGYGFVVGNNGKMLVHPYMPNPQQQMEQPRFYDIDQIEPVLSDEAVFNITNGLPGHFYSKLATFCKTPDVQGTKPATYYYKPILRFRGNYTIVLVIFDEDMEELRADEDIEKGEFPSFIYHRMDLYDNDTLNIAGFCTRDNSVVLKNNATVKFAPSVYSNPVKSLEYEQNNKNRSYPFYQHYRNARLFSKNADIHQSASNDIVLTDITDQVWTQDDMIWRYLGTENGFFKIFPGTMLSDIHYDPRDDVWYRKAAENPDKYVFIDMGTPQQNTSTYVTMAKVFYQTSNGSVSGVVAADMSKRQFTTVLTNMMTSCLHCYILDDAGYVIGQTNASMDLKRAHITLVAGPVSFLLMKQGFLKPEVCMDATSGVKRLTYRLDLGQKGSSIRKVGCHDYTLLTINNTNLYLLSYQPDNCFSLDVGTCNCQEKCLLCNNQMNSMCQCPCTCVNRTTDNCNSTFTMTQGYAPCRESLRHWKTVKTINLHQSNVTECQPQCPSFQTEKDCLLMSGCSWCSTGFYNHIPICTRSCPQDRMEIKMTTPCHNLTEYSHQYLSLEVQKLLLSKVNDSNFDISLPMIIQQDMINFTISTKDRTSIPNSWTEMLSKPFYTKDNIVFINQNSMIEFTLLRLTLAFDNVNFTREQETELTLREYIDVQVKDFILQALGDGNITVSNVWPEQNEISCMLNTTNRTSTTNKAVLMQQIQTWNISTLPTIDVFGRPLSLVNTSVEHSHNTLCHVNCHQM
ncbi:VWFA and cache domain-containing protein 1-like [Mytilus trossulus]|uniref:VWFA and cache domain-containing protein 1-like n=1 Tax=Mytilus trossulus TaxID=6551 RepID=UPI0030072AE0